MRGEKARRRKELKGEIDGSWEEERREEGKRER